MDYSITYILNYWNTVGVFSYVLPFLLIFAIVYAILGKTKLFGDGGNKAVHTIIAIAVGLLALSFDTVPIFFSQLFPKLGVFLALILAVLLLFGFTGVDIGKEKWVKGIGIGAAVIVVLWSVQDFSYFNQGLGGGFLWFFNSELIWSLLILGGIIGLITWVTRESK